MLMCYAIDSGDINGFQVILFQRDIHFVIQLCPAHQGRSLKDNICGALRNLVQCAQFKKREKHA